MKANELKIGDYVSYKGKPAKIHALDSPCIYVDADGEIWGTLEDDGDISLMPLTEEVLEKSGWHKSEYMPGRGRAKLYRRGSATDRDGTVVCFYAQDIFLEMWQEHNIVRKEIKHVHQLQHFLWALGMDDNLKI